MQETDLKDRGTRRQEQVKADAEEKQEHDGF